MVSRCISLGNNMVLADKCMKSAFQGSIYTFPEVSDYFPVFLD